MKKNTLIFIAGVIVGILCLYVWQGYQFMHAAMSAPISEYSTDDAMRRQTFEVVYDQPLQIEMIDSDDAFTLVLSRQANGNVKYVWKPAIGDALGGDGELFEKYEEIAKTPSGRHVNDVGSSLEIELDELSLEWSSGSDSSGWIYYNPSNITIAYQTKKD